MKKTLIAASVSALLLAAAGTASANTLLFPFFTTVGGSVSSVSISGNAVAGANATPGQALPAGFAGENLHYVYNYADPKTGNACTHFDENGTITANDLLQHSVAGPAVGGFGKATPSDGSRPVYLNVPNTQGFLTVTNTTTTGTRAITGDMLLVDPSTNLIFSYAAISNDLDTSAAVGGVSGNEGNFSAAAFQAANFNLSLYPAAAVNTTWYGLVTGDMSPAILARANWDAQARLGNNGLVYDNDENPSSGASGKRISCLGNFSATDLTSTAQVNTLAPRGGLIHATATFPIAGTLLPGSTTVQSVYAGNGLAMYKIQIATSAPAAPLANKVFIHRENGFAF